MRRSGLNVICAITFCFDFSRQGLAGSLLFPVMRSEYLKVRKLKKLREAANGTLFKAHFESLKFGTFED